MHYSIAIYVSSPI